MKCPKCAGLMVEERYLDAHVSLYEWKCINCGLRQDISGSAVHQDRLRTSDAHTWPQGCKNSSLLRKDAANLLDRVQPGVRVSQKPEPALSCRFAA